MSILIKGMNISKKDAESCVCTIKTLRNLAYNTQGVLDWVDHENCDKIIEMLELLVEIPTPHSDLVDRNKLLAEYDRQHKGPAGGARRIMEQADAVIEAEGSEE